MPPPVVTVEVEAREGDARGAVGGRRAGRRPPRPVPAGLRPPRARHPRSAAWAWTTAARPCTCPRTRSSTARADLKTHRTEGVLRVRAFHLEPGVRATRRLGDGFEQALRRLARVVAADAVQR